MTLALWGWYKRENCLSPSSRELARRQTRRRASFGRADMHLVSAAIALALATVVPAEAGAQSWEEYRPAGIGFRIEMPGKPKLETQTTAGGNPVYRAIATFRDMAFTTVYGAKREKKSEDLDPLLDAMVRSATEGKKVLSSKKEMIGGYPARRVLTEDADKDQIEL